MWADKQHIEALQQLTAAERLATMHQLRRTAWDLKAAWIRSSEPELSEAQVQERVRQVFLRAVT